jgi:glycerophosphoryl diester phosphodiesterase
MKLLCETHFLDQCFVSSMEVDALRECRATAPGVLTGRIITEPIDDVSQVEADILSMAASTINREFVLEAHCTGKEVHVWTVNEPTVMLNMIRNGVDNIITDRPDVLRTLLTQHYSPENHFNP